MTEYFSRSVPAPLSAFHGEISTYEDEEFQQMVAMLHEIPTSSTSSGTYVINDDGILVEDEWSSDDDNKDYIEVVDYRKTNVITSTEPEYYANYATLTRPTVVYEPTAAMMDSLISYFKELIPQNHQQVDLIEPVIRASFAAGCEEPPRMPHYTKESGVTIPYETIEDLVEQHACDPIDFTRISFKVAMKLEGGFRRKKKTNNRPNPRRRRRQRGRPDLDCSPGNIYEASSLMVTDATGALNIVIALNNPQAIFPGVTATGAQDLANNWDAYSVERVSMSTQIRAPMTARQGEWNLVCDHDSSPPSTTIAQNLLLTYTDKRYYSSEASPRWSVVPRKLTQCEYISAPGADPEPAVIVSKGKYDWNTPPSNGYMYVKLTGGPASTSIGLIYVRVHVTAWYKRRLAVAVPPLLPCPMLTDGEESSEESNEKVKKPSKKKKD